jgi:hypothetical protein
MGDLYRASARLQNSSLPSDAERARRFREHLVNLRDYLCRNWSGLTNYARDHRQGMRISSAPAESAMSHLVNQRMGKRQPMRWSSEGAHLLLQVGCAVLDNRLSGKAHAVWHGSLPPTTYRVTVPISDPVPDTSASSTFHRYPNWGTRFPT